MSLSTRAAPFLIAFFTFTLATSFVACSKSESGDDAVPDVSGDVPDVADQSAEGDLQELTNYPLTMDAVRKYKQAHDNLERLQKEKPQLAERMKALEEENENATLDDLERKIESVPEARRAVESAGLSVREYASIAFALMMAAFAQFSIEAGANADSVIRSSKVPAANIKFVQQHAAELKQMDLLN